jgi:hypothetical protein
MPFKEVIAVYRRTIQNTALQIVKIAGTCRLISVNFALNMMAFTIRIKADNV